MKTIGWLTLVLLVLASGRPAGADLDGDLVTVELHGPALGSVIDSQDTVVAAGSADALVFGGQNATTIDVDPDLVTLTLGCDFSRCNRINSSAYNGFVLTGLDWSSPPGAPVELAVESTLKYFDPARVVLLTGRIEIDLLNTVWNDGDRILVTPIYAPEVWIDVIPGSDANEIRRRRHIPVALLGSPDLDVFEVDPFSLRFGPGDAPASRGLFSMLVWRFDERDVNRDGHADLVFQFDARRADIPPGAAEACLSGEIGGLAFTACDAVASGP